MYRLNPLTGERFKRGEVREDGKMFDAYLVYKNNPSKLSKGGFWYESWLTPEKYHDKNGLRRSSEQRYETCKKYRLKNKGLYNALGAKRRAQRLQATPQWLTDFDHTYIKCLYQLASMRTRESGEAWHVDHIVPLRGKNVSGLHVPWNLQVIPATENLSKSNKFE